MNVAQAVFLFAIVFPPLVAFWLGKSHRAHIGDVIAAALLLYVAEVVATLLSIIFMSLGGKL